MAKQKEYIMVKINADNGEVEDIYCVDDTGGALNKDFEDRNVNPALQDITPNEIGPYLDNKGILPSEWVAKKRASILKIYSGFSTCVWHGPWLV
jgi:hypothetical protein